MGDKVEVWKSEKDRLEGIFNDKTKDKLERIAAVVEWSKLPLDDCRYGMPKVEGIIKGLIS